VLKDAAGWSCRHPPRRIDLEGRLVKGGVKDALRDRQIAFGELADAVGQSRVIGRFADNLQRGEDEASWGGS
jgi:hypothetical protein